jgi:rhamnosyltransferase
MSTYNGERYLKEQLESLLHQKEVYVEILVRDDGSTDHTIDILSDYQKKGVLQFYTGDNLKPARSFMNLIAKANGADFYAFSDQDDVWEDNKLIEAIKCIQNAQRPALYMSATKSVDQNLNFIQIFQLKTYNTLENAMLKNYAIGCTEVFNDRFLKILQMYEPSFIKMHDSWVCRVAHSIGAYVYVDQNAYILYRQHGDNVLGYKESRLKKLGTQIHTAFFNKIRIRQNIAKELLKGYSRIMTPEAKTLLSAFADYPTNKASKSYLLHDKKLVTPYRNINRRIRLAIRLNKF